jgi:hypothetical protein
MTLQHHDFPRKYTYTVVPYAIAYSTRIRWTTGNGVILVVTLPPLQLDSLALLYCLRLPAGLLRLTCPSCLSWFPDNDAFLCVMFSMISGAASFKDVSCSGEGRERGDRAVRSKSTNVYTSGFFVPLIAGEWKA